MAEDRYTVVPFSTEKIMVADGAYLNRYVKLMQTYFELDIAPLRLKLKAARKNPKGTVSIVACLMYCYAQALDKYKESMALRGKGNKLYNFEEADAFFPIEVFNGERKMLWCKIIKGINKKSVYELEQEIKDAANLTKTIAKAERFFFKLPLWLRNVFYAYMMGTPLLRKFHCGNVYFSSLMHHGDGNTLAYSVASHFHTSGMLLGMYKHVANTDGTTSNILGIALSLDHVISDGQTMVKLVTEFVHQVDNFSL